MAQASHLHLFLMLFAVVCSLSSAQKSPPTKIGLIPWNNVTQAIVKEMLVDLDPLTVVTIPLDTSKSPYLHIEKTYDTVEALNLLAIIGPYEAAIGLASEALNISYLAVTEVTSEPRSSLLELPPHMADIGRAIYDVASRFSWSRVSVFYDDDRGVKLLEKLMTNHTLTVRGWRLPRFADDDKVKKCLVEMRKVLVEQSVVICNRHNTWKILEEARSLAMLSTPPYQWLFYDPGHEFQDLLLSFPDIAINFTVLSLLPFQSSPPRPPLSLDQAFLADAVSLVNSWYRTLTSQNDVASMRPDVTREKMSKQIHQTEFYGETGHLNFDADGKRDNFTLFVTALSDDRSIYTIGRWYSKVDLFDTRLQLSGKQANSNRSTIFPLKGRTAKVVMIEERPFTMMKRDSHMRKGNARFQGFTVDLIDEVARMLDFEYEIYLVNDGKFGSKLKNGEWNGMIGELLAGNATMSVAPLSINSDREEAVDFTKPFMTRYINVLMRVPRRETSYFEFLNPLSPIVWVCTLVSFVVVSVILYILERIGSRSSNSNGAKDTSSPRITMREAFWFIFGSLLQGNTDSSPSTIPGRILTSAWWFFALILISSYTANLAAFLTVKKINTPIKSVSDLALQSKIKYGTVKSSGVMEFFKNSKIEHFAKMWAQMSEIDAESMVDNTSMGFSKVKTEPYAFFWDTTVNKYQTIIDCDVMEIGPPFDPKGFGIGVPPGATYRDELSMAILKLSDQGKLHELETKYWGQKTCPDLSKPSSDETSELQIDNVAGVFFILVGGIGIAAVVCLGEYVGHALLRASKQDRPGRNKSSKNGEVFL